MKTKFGCFLALSLLIGGCDDSASSSSSGGGTDTDTSTTSITTAAGDSSGQADSTSAPTNECEDDYHGNQGVGSLLDLNLDTTKTAQIILGDGIISTPVEQGADELVVCDGEGDYFGVHLSCDSYVSVEVRLLEGSEDPPRIYLYEASSFVPVDSSTGEYTGFFLRPVHQKLSAGDHLIRIAPLVASKRAYSLAVTVLPTQENCS